MPGSRDRSSARHGDEATVRPTTNAVAGIAQGFGQAAGAIIQPTATPVPPELRSLDFAHVLREEASRVTAARERALALHRTGDIDAAGHEVEDAVRDVIRRLLPEAYYVGHGHIVDQTWHVSPQIDVIIADATWSQVMFTADNGTQFFPYEAVYAIGEVKSTYDRSAHQLAEWIEKIKTIRTRLRRNPTPPNYLGNGLYLGANLNVDERRPYRNPLFSFVLYAAGDGFHPDDEADMYVTTPAAELPSASCVLGRGVYLQAHVTKPGVRPRRLDTYVVHPEYEMPPETADLETKWVWVETGPDLPEAGLPLGFLYALLLSHLRSCFLEHPREEDYFLPLLRWRHAISYPRSEPLGEPSNQ